MMSLADLRAAGWGGGWAGRQFNEGFDWLSDKYGARRIMYWTLGVSVVVSFILSYPPTSYVVDGIQGPIAFRFEMYDEVYLCASPLFHIGANSSACALTLHAGTHVFLPPGGFDVPVYLLTVVSPLDHPGGEFAVIETGPVSTTATLADLARWTGGDMRISSVPAHTVQGLQDLFTELRHQYVITFEPGARAASIGTPKAWAMAAAAASAMCSFSTTPR